MAEPNHLEPQKDLNRRNFLKSAITVMGTFIGAGLGLPALGYIISPAFKKDRDQEWIRLGSVSKVQIGQPTLFTFKLQVKTGWIVDEQEISVYVYTEDGRSFLALSNICTHLGCRVRWISEEQEFFCPCHNGVFDKTGQVISGPAPRALDHYQIKVEGSQLFIQGGG